MGFLSVKYRWAGISTLFGKVLKHLKYYLSSTLSLEVWSAESLVASNILFKYCLTMGATSELSS